jgi:hypothetical protein
MLGMNLVTLGLDPLPKKTRKEWVQDRSCSPANSPAQLCKRQGGSGLVRIPSM